MSIFQIGTISQRIIELLGISAVPETPILIGEQNIEHMKREHPEDYAKYGNKIAEIISSPTFIAQNPRQSSIEYIKVYQENNDYVLVAVRVSGGGVYFARTLFVMSKEKIHRYTLKEAFKRY